jgi:hypothetical protein
LRAALARFMTLTPIPDPGSLDPPVLSSPRA